MPRPTTPPLGLRHPRGRAAGTMAEPAAKRRRLAELAGTKGVSLSALASILSQVEEPLSRFAIQRAVQADIDKTPTPHGPTLVEVALPLEDGGTWKWVVPHPAALLTLLATLSSTFAAGLHALHARQPATYSVARGTRVSLQLSCPGEV